MATTKQLKLTMYRSMNGRLKSHKSCARGLGIRKMHNSVFVTDTPENPEGVSNPGYDSTVQITFNDRD